MIILYVIINWADVSIILNLRNVGKISTFVTIAILIHFLTELRKNYRIGILIVKLVKIPCLLSYFKY
jgi:hypothetical protein